MYEVTPEVLEKVRQSTTKEEIIKLSKECGIELSAEDVEMIFDKFHPSEGKLAEEELDAVAGGGVGIGGCNDATCNIDFTPGETFSCSPFQFNLTKKE